MGTLSLPDASVVYIDTSVVIYSVEQVEGYSELLEPLWNQLWTGALHVLSSELILLESLVLPLRLDNEQLVKAYERLLLSSRVQLLPITQTILREAAQLRARTRLKTPDAVHVATGLSVNCTMFLTNDEQLRTVSGLPTVVLSDLLD
ncbi:MAG: type II toxin-antitoxin system VapC family toxin [Cyanobacteria bacterium P01_F01_bin.86]